MAKKNDDNYSWLDKYSTDPRDTAFDDITQRHQDRQRRNTRRDANDRINDEHNLLDSSADAASFYDSLVSEVAQPTATPPPPPPAVAAAPAAPRATTTPPPPPSSMGAPPMPASVPNGPALAPPPPSGAAQRRPDRLPSLQLEPTPSSARPQPARRAPADTSLLERLRQVPRSVFVPVIFGVLFLISALSSATDDADSGRAVTVPSQAGTEVRDLVPGDCFLAPPASGNIAVQRQSCSELHGGEVLAIVTGTVTEALEACTDIAQTLDPEVRERLPEGTSVTLLLNDPTHRCVVLSRSGSLIGSVTDPG